MHLSTIRYIVTIASFGSFTKAAEALFITQPALSQAVRRYEEELHTPIFIRTRSGLELTEAGKIIVEDGKRILELEAGIERKLSEFIQAQALTISFGAAATYQTFFLTKLLSRFRECQPTARIRIRDGYSRELCSLLLDGSLDFALICEPIPPELTAIPVFQEEVFLAAAPSHPLPTLQKGPFDGYPVADLAKCRDESFIGYQNGRRIQQILLDETHAAGFDPHISTTCFNTETANSMVYHNMGIAIIPAVAAKLCNSERQPQYYRLRSGGLMRTWNIVYYQTEKLSPICRAFLGFLQESGFGSLPVATIN